MNYIKPHLLEILVVLTLPCLLFARQQEHAQRSHFNDTLSVEIPLTLSDSVYRLSRGYIVRKSEKVWLDSLTVLTPSDDYEFNYDEGSIRLNWNRRRSL